MTLLVLLWICWCILHSLLITATVNRWVRKKGGFLQGSYRLAYILFSCISLIPLLWYQYSLPQEVIFSWHGSWRLVQLGLLLYAAVLFYTGKKIYDTDFFLGISQWRDYCGGQPDRETPFSSQGVLGYVRHPWYSGGLAFLWGLGSLTDVTLSVKIILTLYLVIGTLLEEKKLKQELGLAYLEYCRKVPMLIPRFSRAKTEND